MKKIKVNHKQKKLKIKKRWRKAKKRYERKSWNKIETIDSKEHKKDEIKDDKENSLLMEGIITKEDKIEEP